MLIDRSSLILVGGQAQLLMPANTSRVGLWIQNADPQHDLWINELGTASPTAPSLWLPAGSFHEFPRSGIPITAISIYGDTTNQLFSCREW